METGYMMQTSLRQLLFEKSSIARGVYCTSTKQKIILKKFK